jgi:hypothetical protein
MKTCASCKQELPLSSFRLKQNRGKETHQAYCIDCNKKYQQQHYLDHKADYLNRSAERRDAYRQDIFLKLRAYLLTHPCVGCGEEDPLVLEFDHRDRELKTFAISAGVRASYSWERLLPEIEKCDVRCANCHRRRTAEQFGWMKAVLEDLV